MTDREHENHFVWPQSKQRQSVTMSTGDAAHSIGKWTWLWKDVKIAMTSKSGQILARFERRN